MSLADITKVEAKEPLLQPGDQLCRVEFERRYHAMPDCKKAELIEGIVYMPSPARLRHSQPHTRLITWIGNFVDATPGTDYADNATNRLDSDNDPQPDVALFIDAACGGQTRISEDDYLTGPAEFVAEVSVSSLALDRGPKLRTYQRHGVREYLIWRVDDNLFEWYILRDDGFQLQALPEAGVLKSEAFPGLWLNVAAMLKREGASVMRTLSEGLATSAHAEFVKQLNERRPR